MSIPDSLEYVDPFVASFESDDMLVLRWNQHLLNLCYDVRRVFAFYEKLNAILHGGGFRTMVSLGSDIKPGFAESATFLHNVLQAKDSAKFIERFFNLVNTYVLTLSSLNAVTIHADHGNVSLFALNVSLAYDYRIVAQDTVFENSNAEVGLISKGGGAYFMSRLLGVRKAAEVLQWSAFSAEEALQLGLVDRIVPRKDLEQEALEMAKAQSLRPTSMLLGLRKLLKCDPQELKRNLELENQLILGRVSTPDFKKAFTECCAAKGIVFPD
ncbi:enoyl-CoA hydratase [Fundidesulfovibrio butyratiphilus]